VNRTGKIHGLLVEFDSPEPLIEAVQKVREAGYRDIDAYTPFPVEELERALELPRTRLPLIMLLGGIAGAIGGFGLQYYVSVIAYPLNVGGRPLNSWPAFIPVTFEATILVAALSGVLAMLALNGLPMPYHPVFNVERFRMASRNSFFLCIESRDPRFDLERTREWLESITSREVLVVPK
jgi:hypothetical protein